MNKRSSRSMVTFLQPFTLAGYPDELPAGKYEILVEEELLQGLSFEAFRRTATYLTVRGQGGRAGTTEMRPITEKDLETALNHDRAVAQSIYEREAALSPPEDLK